MNCQNCKHWVFGKCQITGIVVGSGALCNAWELSLSHEQVNEQPESLADTNIIDLNVDEKVLSTDFDDMPKLDRAYLMIEALINAGYRMIITRTDESRDKWRALVRRWRSS